MRAQAVAALDEAKCAIGGLEAESDTHTQRAAQQQAVVQISLALTPLVLFLGCCWSSLNVRNRHDCLPIYGNKHTTGRLC